MADRVRRCQNDHRAARSAHPSLRHRRDRQRELAVQESKLSTVTTGAKGDVVLGYDGSGLRPPPSYPRTTMRWWSPFTCRSRRSEEHTSELQSLMRISYAVFWWKKKTKTRLLNKLTYEFPDTRQNVN